MRYQTAQMGVYNQNGAAAGAVDLEFRGQLRHPADA